MSPDVPQQPDHGVFSIGADDPDRPFAFEAYVAIASYVLHHGRCEVHVAALPYGMWWQELRSSIDLVIAPLQGPTDQPTGIWTSPDKWIAPTGATEGEYETAAAPYRTAVTWLDRENDSEADRQLNNQQQQPEHA